MRDMGKLRKVRFILKRATYHHKVTRIIIPTISEAALEEQAEEIARHTTNSMAAG